MFVCEVHIHIVCMCVCAYTYCHTRGAYTYRHTHAAAPMTSAVPRSNEISHVYITYEQHNISIPYWKLGSPLGATIHGKHILSVYPNTAKYGPNTAQEPLRRDDTWQAYSLCIYNVYNTYIIRI